MSCDCGGADQLGAPHTAAGAGAGSSPRHPTRSAAGRSRAATPPRRRCQPVGQPGAHHPRKLKPTRWGRDRSCTGDQLGAHATPRRNRGRSRGRAGGRKFSPRRLARSKLQDDAVRPRRGGDGVGRRPPGCASPAGSSGRLALARGLAFSIRRCLSGERCPRSVPSVGGVGRCGRGGIGIPERLRSAARSAYGRAASWCTHPQARRRVVGNSVGAVASVSFAAR